MGEAKRRREETRARFIAEAELWASPVTVEERETVERIATLSFQPINRASPEQLAYMKMQPQECHANAMAYAKLDPQGLSRVVTGWWQPSPGTFVAHSVVERSGGMVCITPHHIEQSHILFAPDPGVEWIEEGERLRPRIEGKPLPRILRADPETTIAASLIVLERLKTMANPYEAVNYPIPA